tara:strand:+ start:105 stop:443 length:339 start_codon:yes stop_codon:yes gene_type:complete
MVDWVKLDELHNFLDPYEKCAVGLMVPFTVRLPDGRYGVVTALLRTNREPVIARVWTEGEMPWDSGARSTYEAADLLYPEGYRIVAETSETFISWVDATKGTPEVVQQILAL